MAAADELDPTASMLTFFATEARRIRTEAGIAQMDVANQLFVTPSLLSKIEAAQRVPSEDLAANLDRILATNGHFERLWPLVMRYAYPSWFRPFVDLEAEATEIRAFEHQLVPGLLQTEEYARAIFSSGRHDNVDELVAARMGRQHVLARETPPRLWVILDENVFQRIIGSPAVMRGQLARLVEAARSSPRVVVQVIPYAVGAHAALAGPFWTFSFAEGPDVLHVDGYRRGELVADPHEVKESLRAYDLLRAAALPPEASIDFIEARMKDLDP